MDREFSVQKMKEVFTELFKDSYPKQISPGVWQLSENVTVGEEGYKQFLITLKTQIEYETRGIQTKSGTDEKGRAAEEETNSETG